MIYVDYFLDITSGGIKFTDEEMTIQKLKENHGFDVGDTFTLIVKDGRVILRKEFDDLK